MHHASHRKNGYPKLANAMRPVPARITLALAAAVAMMLLAPSTPLAEHPPLPKGGAASCILCHDDKTADAGTLHAPVADDCTTCHEVNVSEEATTVTLMAEEPDLCILCHDSLQNSVDMDQVSPHPAVAMGCTTCHDPHVSERPRLLTSDVPELCQSCHDLDDLGEVHSNQLTAASDCRSCHSSHGSDNPSMLKAAGMHMPFSTGSCSACHRDPIGDRNRLRSRGERLCTACHSDITDKTAGGSEHAALHGEKGRAGCLSCHDPHMSDESALLAGDTASVCGTCHQDVVAAATSETGHAAAAADCLTCHQPHTADEPRLLAFPKSEMCQACHDVGDEDLKTVHLGADLNTLSCTSCHDPHGTGNEHLLARVTHAALSMGCDSCHSETPGQFNADSITELCTACHSDVAEAAASAQVPHAAMEIAECTTCHNPHASSRDSLVRGEGGEPCISCHSDQEAGKGEHSHGVIDVAGCQSCHMPHGGDNQAMLRMEEPDLCLDCHDNRRRRDTDENGKTTVLGSVLLDEAVAKLAASLNLNADNTIGHPINNHRVLGQPTPEEYKNTETLFRGAFTCSTCHTPHKSQSEFLFLGDISSRSEACSQCHTK